MIWIADTGSANHLCSHDTLPGDVFEGMRPCPDVRLATANGIIHRPRRGRSLLGAQGLPTGAQHRAPGEAARLPVPLEGRQGLVRGS